MDGITADQLRIEKLEQATLLSIEKLGQATLLHNHMYWVSECAKMDLWKDISDTFAYKCLEAYGNEIRIRMSAI
jgi:hypothetical protein